VAIEATGILEVDGVAAMLQYGESGGPDCLRPSAGRRIGSRRVGSGRVASRRVASRDLFGYRPLRVPRTSEPRFRERVRPPGGRAWANLSRPERGLGLNRGSSRPEPGLDSPPELDIGHLMHRVPALQRGSLERCDASPTRDECRHQGHYSRLAGGERRIGACRDRCRARISRVPGSTDRARSRQSPQRWVLRLVATFVPILDPAARPEPRAGVKHKTGASSAPVRPACPHCGRSIRNAS
jgi:hypothetical protein